ncbi:MAG: ABC transporter substrate-binding protein [Hyphomicrobiaceae bacterium]
MMDRRTLLLGSVALVSAASTPLLAQTSTPFKVGSVKFGSLNWLMETIKAEGIATALGLDVTSVELSNNQAGPISLLSGGSDLIVSDWTWALRQRGLGEALKFAPYSSTLGGVVVPAASPIKSLTDLAGKRIGVAGSGIDKSWLLLQAYSRKKLSFDIASKATVQFGAAPLLSEQVRDGSLDACLNFWTQNVRLSALGFRQIIGMTDVMTQLAINPVPAFVGFVWKEQTQTAKQPQLFAFLKAVDQANAILAGSDAKADVAWARIKPLMKAASDAEATALRAAYTSGISRAWTSADMTSADKIMKLLIEAGDTEFVGAATKFDPKLFHVASA